MGPFQSSSKPHGIKTAIAVSMGAAAGLAAGLLTALRLDPQRAERWSRRLREGVREVGDRIRPERLARVREEVDALEVLEDAVLDVLRAHDVLGERGIDVGAISAGIVELSGSVWTEEEADLAVQITRGVPDVETVVNRIEIDVERDHLEVVRRRERSGTDGGGSGRWSGRNVGMGRMRQSPATEPARRDDSQKLQERALADADLDDAVEETMPSADEGRSAG